MKKAIGIIGHGYVGQAMDTFFQRRNDLYQVMVYDPKYISEDRNARESIFTMAKHADFIFVCVPTPIGDDGKCDTTLVKLALASIDQSIRDIARIDKPIVVIKSTVEVGTCKELDNKYSTFKVVFSPEFCGESKYWSPYEFDTEVAATPFFIFGGYPKVTTLCVDLFLTVTGPVKTYFQCEYEEAELTKYIENSYYAMKIAFCNQMYDLCDSMVIDWNTVREAWQLDPRVNPMHTAVFKDDRGFGGKCFPKDTLALEALSKAKGVPATILTEVLAYNNKLRNKDEQ